MFFVFIKAPTKIHFFVVFLDPYCDCFGVLLSVRSLWLSSTSGPTGLCLRCSDCRNGIHALLGTFEIEATVDEEKKSHVQCFFVDVFIASILYGEKKVDNPVDILDEF